MAEASVNVLVLNGSPKGDLSVTLQYAAFLQKTFPAHSYKTAHIGQRIKSLEREGAAFDTVMADVRAADLVLWTTPVYYMLVPGQLKRFIELVIERGAAGAFSGRYAAALMTSIHFFDHTAHDYLAGISEDWKMPFAGAHLAEMHDLLKKSGREQLVRFAGSLFGDVIRRAVMPVSHAPIAPRAFAYAPGPVRAAADLSARTIGPGRAPRALVVADGLERSPNLAGMVSRLAASFSPPPEVVDLADEVIKAGCQGCLECGLDNTCVFEGKDGFTALFREKIITADILIFAGDIRDRYLSARWKMFFDRSFFRGHAPSLTGKQLAWVVAGPLRQISNLRQILEAYTQMQRANLLGLVTDEDGDSARLDGLLDDLAARATDWTVDGFRRPVSFLGVGGHLLLRDRVWSDLRFVFQADHRYYRRAGFYDFPQRRVGVRLRNILAPVIRLPFLRRQFLPRIKPSMVIPFRRVVGAKRKADRP